MQVWRKYVWVLLVVCVIGLMACGGGTSTSSGGETADGATLLQDRCTGCHGLSKIEGQQKTQAEWEQTVTRMVEKGATLNADEQAILVAYLAETY